MRLGYGNALRNLPNKKSSVNSTPKILEEPGSLLSSHSKVGLNFVYNVNDLTIELDLEKILSFRDAKSLSNKEIEDNLIQISSWAASIIYLLSYFSDIKSTLQVNFDIWWAKMISEAEKSIMAERASGLDSLAKLPESASAIEIQIAKEKIRMFRDSFGTLSRTRVGEYLIQVYSDEYLHKKQELQDVEIKLNTLERVFKELGEKSNNLRAVYKYRAEERHLKTAV